jgi:L,D-transpeptidase YcbB
MLSYSLEKILSGGKRSSWMAPKRPAAGILSCVLLCAAALVPACRHPRASPVEATRRVLETRVGPAGADGPVYCRYDQICGSDVLPSFYRARNFRPAWIDDGLSLSDASSFLAALRLVREDGLDPANYHLAAIESLITEVQASQEKKRKRVGPDTLVDLEMLLTDAFFLCGSHLVHGQVNPETVESEWSIKGRIEDLAAALEKGLAGKDIAAALDSLRPQNAVYKGLKKAYLELGAIAGACGWPGVPPGPKLEKGDRNARVDALRSSLEARGDLVPTEGGERSAFDDGLETAVKAFQGRHGLEPDGVVGRATTDALNVPAAGRKAQIRANLERWRWITPDLGERYILINVADFRVSVVEGGREVMSMPAIVGRDYRRTPEFSGKLSYVEINPSWTVPPKLAREDILPKVRKDHGYLANKGIRVFRDWSAGAPEIDPDKIDWPKVKGETLSFKFRQDPGPENALGRVKFIFPNKFDVYLHDTPERGLFSRAVRNLSSGCIRVMRPVDLAEYVLRDDPAGSREKILEAMDDGMTRVIVLRNSIGVHLLYWTAWRTEDGRVEFREDIYQRDAALYKALEQPAAAPGRTSDLPGPDAADVDVNEIRHRIEPHAPAP